MAKVTVDPTSPRYVYATAQECSAASYCKDYVYRSADRGVTWTRSLTAQIDSIAVQASSTGVVYATSNIPNGDGADGRLYRSVDHGRTWKIVTDRLKDTPFGSVAVDPKDPNIVLVETAGNKVVEGGELLRSTDGGRTWATWRAAMGVDHLTFSATGRAVYAQTGQSGLMRSGDGGATWTTALDTLDDVIEAMATNPLDPRELYVATAEKGIYRSTDEGLTFSLLPLPAEKDAGTRFLYLDRANPQTLYANAGQELWAYTLPMRAGGLPGTGSPTAETLATLAGLGAALSLIGVRLRRSTRGLERHPSVH